MNTIDTIISTISGHVGVAARHLTTGKQFLRNADEPFFTASTLKVPLLVELYRQVDAGILDIGKRITLEDKRRVPGSGVLRELDNGISPTLHDLAMLMIIVSDNLATDILYHTIGRGSIEKAMQAWGLSTIKTPMSTRELLFDLVGMDVDDTLESFWEVSERIENKGYKGLRPDCDALNEEKSDVASPADMARLLEMVERGEILSPSSRDAVLHILKRQKLKTVIPAQLPQGTITAHKTGGVHSVRCDVGLVYAPNGPYAVALMAKRITDRTELDTKMARLSRAIYDEMAG